MTITNFKGREAPKAARSAMETLLFSLDEVSAWKIPPFQRPIRVNDKVRSASEQIKDDGGVIPGVITLGKLPSDKSYYIVDGQHRVEAFNISGLLECSADVRIIRFASMAEMGTRKLRSSSQENQRGLRFCELRQHSPWRFGITAGEHGFVD